MDNPLGQFAVAIATQLPLLLVYLIGIVLAMVWYARCPSASLAAMFAFVVLIINAFALTAIQVWVSRYLVESGNFEDVGQALQWFYGVTRLVGSVTQAAAMLLLLFAIFKGRTAPLPQKFG